MLSLKQLRSALWISVFSAACTLAGCAGKPAVLPEKGPTMLEIYREHMGSASNEALAETRMTLRRPLTHEETNPKSYTRTAENEIDALFVRLPNPDLVMYVFPHLATDEGVPVPGYSTVFPMYERVIYALPGEIPWVLAPVFSVRSDGRPLCERIP